MKVPFDIILYNQCHSVDITFDVYTSPSRPILQVIFDTASSGSPHALRTHIANLIELPPERLRLAKHKLETFEWIKIQDSYEVIA